MESPALGAAEVRRLARDLLPRALTISSRVTERVLQIVPELAPAGAPDAVALVQESTDQNIGAMLSTLAFGVTPTTIEPPAGTQDLLDNLATAGGNVTDLLRAYRVGHQLLWRLWSEHVYAEIRQPELLPDVLRISSAHLFDFIDQACQRIVENTPAPGSDTGPRRLGDRHEVVRRLLGSDPVDLGAATASLAYELTRHHVALLVAPLAEVADVRRELDGLLAAAPVPAFAIPSGEGSWWGWLGFPTPPTADQLAAVAAVRVTGVLAGMGEPGRGREGFRRSLAQAREAERVGRLAQHPRPGVVRHRDIEIAAILCGDPDRARALAAARLGDLARRDEPGERLRATVRALLANGHNRGRAAAALHVHHKTVAYRLNQAEELLGRSLSDDTFGLETALLIDQTLYGP
jgi:DNA-binding PucR family transcriptional regulator